MNFGLPKVEIGQKMANSQPFGLHVDDEGLHHMDTNLGTIYLVYLVVILSWQFGKYLLARQILIMPFLVNFCLILFA